MNKNPSSYRPFGAQVVLKKDQKVVSEVVEGTTLLLHKPVAQVKLEQMDEKCEGMVIVAGKGCEYAEVGMKVVYFKYAAAQGFEIDEEHIIIGEENLLAEVA